MKRYSAHMREESFEHVLMCLICRSLFDEQEHQPKFLPCHHTFCKDCLREYVRQSGDEIECPSCRKIATIPAAGVTALQTNFYVKYIHNLVRGGSSGCSPGMEVARCKTHSALQQTVTQFCRTCGTTVCKVCLESGCAAHERVPIATATEESHVKLDSGFEKCNSTIEAKKTELEALMKSLALEKDEALKHIEAIFEQHSHTLNRRATLLKNKVIDIYNDHARNLDGDMEEISTALTCIISLKEYHEELISKGLFSTVEQGLNEIDEVYNNISQHIHPRETHIVFEEKHGMEKFKAVCKDLGRVTSSHPMVTRAEPIGGHATPEQTSPPAAPSGGSESEESPYPEEQGACGGIPLQLLDPIPKDHQGEGMRGSFLRSHDMPSLSLHGSSSLSLPLHVHPDVELPVRDTNTGQAETEQPCSQSGTDAGQPAAVRPKTLDSSKRKMKMNLQNNSGSRSKTKLHHSLPAAPNCYVKSLQSGHQQHGLAMGPGVSATLQAHFGNRMPPKPDLEAVRQADMMYHHLVYTSYDEDELLRELRGAGKVVYTDPTKLNCATESDSWQTTSSCDDLTASLDEENQQTTL